METTIELVEAKDRLHQVLLERFYEAEDGYWYPIGKGTPLVRIHLREQRYTIERRRTPVMPWIQLVEAVRCDFDVDSFAAWADSFQMLVKDT